ncbi:hypothetical protein MBLNU457_5567t2 [Dothideomycetes sp. NU457]
MLHEVLLALSGHPSPLFKSDSSNKQELHNGTINHDFPDLAPAEGAMLESLGKLALVHRQLRAHLRRVVANHSSTIVKAVASSLLHVHLKRFQDKILNVESSILSEDPNMVGAYNIVPLAAVVGEFEEWHRLMDWYWRASIKMMSLQSQTSTASQEEASGAMIIDYLRAESHTGWPEIAGAAIELSRIAESAWLKHLSPWLLHGRLPQFGSADFFVDIDQPRSNADQAVFRLSVRKLPAFVSSQTAASMLFIGKSLYQLNQYDKLRDHPTGGKISDYSQLKQDHLRFLTRLPLPLTPVVFSRAVTSIRRSLSRNILQHLLSPQEIKLCLRLLRSFFLLENGEFASAFIVESEYGRQQRQASMGRLLEREPAKSMQTGRVTDGELTETMARTWKALSTIETEDDSLLFLEEASKSIHLESAVKDAVPLSRDGQAKDSIRQTIFLDVLFPVASKLVMQLKPPLDLFLAPADLEEYSYINTYLLVIRRSQHRLSGLWKLTGARRRLLNIDNRKDSQRHASLRKVWATCSSALFLLSEMSAYLEGEIVKSSWDHYIKWALGQPHTRGEASRPPGDDSALTEKMHDMSLHDDDNDLLHHDPETLASGHRAFLVSLVYAILLTDDQYTKSLRALVSNIDMLIGYFERLQALRSEIDMCPPEAVSQFTTTEEAQVALELDRARKRTDSDMKSLVARLRELDEERIGSGRYKDLTGVETGGFVPWREGGGVDRLLMKLDFGRMTEIEARDRDLII